MIKAIKFQIQRIVIKAKMRSIKSEIEAAQQRIAHDTGLVDLLWRDCARLQSEAFWLEKNNLTVKRMAV